MKKSLSEQQEFEIMKLVLDKFLWLGFILMAFGLYQTFANSLISGLVWIVAGTILLILFVALIVKEYELIR
jgi:hypothetical protein